LTLRFDNATVACEVHYLAYQTVVCIITNQKLFGLLLIVVCATVS